MSEPIIMSEGEWADWAERRIAALEADVVRFKAKLEEDLLVAADEIDALKHTVDTHEHVLEQAWGLWHANHRMIMSLAGMADSRKSKWLRRLLGKWLNKDQAAMVKLLGWADKQVNGS